LYSELYGPTSYPSLAFECISDYDRQITSVFGPQMGSRNDKHIVKNDVSVLSVGKEWYKTVEWNYFNNDGEISTANLESVRKDVECVFGILKGRFGCLDSGFKHRRIAVCEMVFLACCVLHNMMVDEMKREPPPERLERGCRMPDAGVWLAGPTVLTDEELHPTMRIDKLLRNEFHRRRNILAKHIWWWNVNKCKNGEIRCTNNINLS